MFGVSLPELILIFIVVLIVFGPERLPEMARTLGKLMAELRRNTDSLRREFYNTVYLPAKGVEDEIRKTSLALKSVKEEIKIELTAGQEELKAELAKEQSNLKCLKGEGSEVKK